MENFTVESNFVYKFVTFLAHEHQNNIHRPNGVWQHFCTDLNWLISIIVWLVKMKKDVSMILFVRVLRFSNSRDRHAPRKKRIPGRRVGKQTINKCNIPCVHPQSKTRKKLSRWSIQKGSLHDTNLRL